MDGIHVFVGVIRVGDAIGIRNAFSVEKALYVVIAEGGKIGTYTRCE